jgi:hypothetical protein
MNNMKWRPQERVWTRERHWGDAIKLFAGFCAAVALMSALLYAGSGRHYEKFMQPGPAGEFSTR